MPSGFEQVATRHLGAWLFGIFRDVWTATFTAVENHDDSGFVGDVLTVFRTPSTSDVTSVWRLRFETPENAAALVSHLLDRSWLSASQVDRDVVVVASTDDAVPAAVIGGLTWTAAPEEDSTDPARTASDSPLPWACPLVR